MSMKKKKPLPINLTVKTKKLSFSKDTDMDCYDRLERKIKKLYKADEMYLTLKGEIEIYRREVVGTYKSKRIDGVKI
jgi:hypothetical protein